MKVNYKNQIKFYILQTETMLGTVFLECVVSFSDPAKAKWVFEGRKLETDGDYKVDWEQLADKQHKYTCEIKVCFLRSN
jgi:hypothetical protein